MLKCGQNIFVSRESCYYFACRQSVLSICCCHFARSAICIDFILGRTVQWEVYCGRPDAEPRRCCYFLNHHIRQNIVIMRSFDFLNRFCHANADIPGVLHCRLILSEAQPLFSSILACYFFLLFLCGEARKGRNVDTHPQGRKEKRKLCAAWTKHNSSRVTISN